MLEFPFKTCMLGMIKDQGWASFYCTCASNPDLVTYYKTAQLTKLVKVLQEGTSLDDPVMEPLVQPPSIQEAIWGKPHFAFILFDGFLSAILKDWDSHRSGLSPQFSRMSSVFFQYWFPPGKKKSNFS